MRCRCSDISACKKAIEILREASRYNDIEIEHDRAIEGYVNSISATSATAYEASNMDTICTTIKGLNDNLTPDRENLSMAINIEIHRLAEECSCLESEDKEYHKEEEARNE